MPQKASDDVPGLAAALPPVPFFAARAARTSSAGSTQALAPKIGEALRAHPLNAEVWLWMLLTATSSQSLQGKQDDHRP